MPKLVVFCFYQKILLLLAIEYDFAGSGTGILKFPPISGTIFVVMTHGYLLTKIYL